MHEVLCIPFLKWVRSSANALCSFCLIMVCSSKKLKWVVHMLVANDLGLFFYFKYPVVK